MASAFPVAPPDEYVRPAPNWLTKALALSEADTERQRACDQAEVTSALFTSINESLIQSAPTSTYTPRLARLPGQAVVSLNRRVSKQEVVSLPIIRAERTKALAAALNLSPRVVSSSAKAQLLLTTTPSALRNGAVESAATRADMYTTRTVRYGGTARVAAGEKPSRRARSEAPVEGEESPLSVMSLEASPGAAAVADAVEGPSSGFTVAVSPPAGGDGEAAGGDTAAAAAAAAPQTLSESLRTKLASQLFRVMDLFRAADVNNDASISPGEFRDAIARAGIEANESELTRLFEHMGATL